MAQSEILGLFGLTPEAYQQSQRAADERAALQYAQLDPMSAARMGFFQAGQGIGRGVGSLLGVEDPQLQMIAQQQQILRNVDQNDPESIAAGARMAAEMGNPRLAAALGELQRKTMESKALVAQREAAAKRERVQQVPTSIQEAQYVADLEAAKRQLEGMPQSPERDAQLATINAQLGQLVRPERTQRMNYGAEAERTAMALFGKPYSDLTQDQMRTVNTEVNKSASSRAPQVNVNIPGVKEVKDLPKLRGDIQNTIKDDLAVIRATQQALGQLDISIKSSNPIAFNAARVQLARAIGGGGDLAIREIQAAGGDPSLVGRLLDTGSTLFTGTPTVELQNQIKTTLNALKTVATNRANNELQTQRDLAVAAGFKPEDISKVFKFKELESVAPVNLNPKDAAAAELARRRNPQK
jgi:hypothetical protein